MEFYRARVCKYFSKDRLYQATRRDPREKSVRSVLINIPAKRKRGAIRQGRSSPDPRGEADYERKPRGVYQEAALSASRRARIPVEQLQPRKVAG